MAQLKTQSSTWYEWIMRFVPNSFKVGNLGKYVTVAYGFTTTVGNQAMAEAENARLLRMPGSPNDALALIGNERSLPRYAPESDDEYRTRLADAWEFWPIAGDETSIVNTLANVGFPGARIETNLTASAGSPIDGIAPWPTSSAYWSQFRVFVPVFQKDPNLDQGIQWGSGAVFGQPGLVWGGSGQLLSFDDIRTIRLIIEKFKPVDWVCREIVLTYTGSYEEHHAAFPI